MARIGGNAWLMDSARMLTANAVDLGEKPSVLSAILKYHLTERGRECIGHAMDVHGGKGIIMGPNNYLGRNWQGAPIFITVEGANILSRNLMIFGQGAIRCHPFVLKEMALAGREDKQQALIEFDSLLLKHIGFAVSNAASTFILNLGFGHFERAPGNGLSQGYFRALNRQAAAFAMLADLSMMLLGGELKRRERLSARLGDVLSHMYLASAALKRYHDLGSPDHMSPLFRWAMEESLGHSERAMDEILSNFPNRILGGVLRAVVFPFGRRHKGPSDRLMPKLLRYWAAPRAIRRWKSCWQAAIARNRQTIRSARCNKPSICSALRIRCIRSCKWPSRVVRSSRTPASRSLTPRCASVFCRPTKRRPCVSPRQPAAR